MNPREGGEALREPAGEEEAEAVEDAHAEAQAREVQAVASCNCPVGWYRH